MGVNTVFGNCGSASAGSYVTASCVPGSTSQVGMRIQTAACSGPNPTQFVAAVCVAGSWSTLGSNTLIYGCSGSSPGYYQSGSCFNGGYATLGTDTQISPCPPGQYQNNAGAASCRQAQAGYYVSNWGQVRRAAVAPPARKHHPLTHPTPRRRVRARVGRARTCRRRALQPAGAAQLASSRTTGARCHAPRAQLAITPQVGRRAARSAPTPVPASTTPAQARRGGVVARSAAATPNIRTDTSLGTWRTRT